MAKFKITYNTTNVIPEESGWVWCSETISAPSPRYKFVNLGGASGSVDMSKASSGSLLYDDREIKVTFARFKKGQDGWLDNVVALDTSVSSAFSSGYTVYIFPKTESNIKYTAKAFKREVSRDGIIQFVTLTFRIAPDGTAVS
jgi:hypothetical protein